MTDETKFQKQTVIIKGGEVATLTGFAPDGTPQINGGYDAPVLTEADYTIIADNATDSAIIAQAMAFGLDPLRAEKIPNEVRALRDSSAYSVGQTIEHENGAYITITQVHADDSFTINLKPAKGTTIKDFGIVTAEQIQKWQIEGVFEKIQNTSQDENEFIFSQLKKQIAELIESNKNLKEDNAALKAQIRDLKSEMWASEAESTDDSPEEESSPEPIATSGAGQIEVKILTSTNEAELTKYRNLGWEVKHYQFGKRHKLDVVLERQTQASTPEPEREASAEATIAPEPVGIVQATYAGQMDEFLGRWDDEAYESAKAVYETVMMQPTPEKRTITHIAELPAIIVTEGDPQ